MALISNMHHLQHGVECLSIHTIKLVIVVSQIARLQRMEINPPATALCWANIEKL